MEPGLNCRKPVLSVRNRLVSEIRCGWNKKELREGSCPQFSSITSRYNFNYDERNRMACESRVVFLS